MQPSKLIRAFFLLLVYSTILLAPWPGVDQAYGWCFRKLGDTAFTWFLFWPEGRVNFLDLNAPTLRDDIDKVWPGSLPQTFRPPGPTKSKDTLMVLRHRNVATTFGLLRTSSRILYKWPVALIIALTLATPLSWKKRGFALLWGLFFVHLFVVFRLSLTLAANGFALDKAYGLFSPSPFWMNLLNRCEQIAVENPTVSFVVPAMIWFLVAFRTMERTLVIPTDPESNTSDSEATNPPPEQTTQHGNTARRS